MSPRDVKLRLEDMLEAIERIEHVLSGITLEDFELAWERRWLVERGFEIVSEASRHLPAEMKARHPAIPWSKVAGIGNILRHAYDRVAPDILWKLATIDLADLKIACRAELKQTS